MEEPVVWNGVSSVVDPIEASKCDTVNVVELIRNKIYMNKTFGGYLSSSLKIDRFQREQMLADEFYYQLEAELLTQELDHRTEGVVFEIPKTWFEHFKKECFPNWLLKKFPVKYNIEKREIEYKVEAYYPHANISIDGGDRYYVRVNKYNNGGIYE